MVAPRVYRFWKALARVPAAVAYVTCPTVLGSKTSDLGPGQAGDPLDVSPHQALVWFLEGVISAAGEHSAYEVVGGSTVGGLDVRDFITAQEAPNLIERAYALGARLLIR